MTTWAQQAAQAFDRAVTAIQGVQADLGGMGWQLWAYVALIAFSWQGLRWVMAQGDITQIAGGVMRTVMLIGFSYWLMPNSGKPSPLITFVISLSSDVAKTIVGPGGLTAAVETMNTQIGQMQNSVAEMMRFVWREGGVLSWMEQLPSLLPLGMAQFVLMGASMSIFMVGLGGMILMQAGAILAPLFIPWMMLSLTRWIFDGWLRWFISAALYQVLGAVFLKISGAVLQTAVPPVAGADPASWGVGMGGATVVLLLAYTTYWVVQQVPQLASGLIAGGATLAGTPNPGGAAAAAASRGITSASKAIGDAMKKKK